jgi:hypothetical protein
MRYLILILVAFLIGCDQPKTGKDHIKPTFDRTGLPIVTTTYYYDSVEDVMAAYRDFYQLPKSQRIPRLYGFAVWPEWRDEDGNRVEFVDNLWCQIHSIRPIRIDDLGTLTHGHEGVHCVFGEYHND